MMALVLMTGLQVSPASAQIDGDATEGVWKVKYGVTDAQMADNGWLGADSDGDGMSNGDEIYAGTNPFLAGSVVRITQVTTDATDVHVTFPTVPKKLYVLQGSGSLSGFAAFSPSVSGVGTGSPLTLSGPKGSHKFFRVLVQDVDTDGDGLADWVENEAGLNPNSSQSNPGVNDHTYVTEQLTFPHEVNISATAPFASEDGPQAGSFKVTRTQKLLPISIDLGIGGTAVAGADYTALPASLNFAAGADAIDLSVNPIQNPPSVEGGESVTATLQPPAPGDTSFALGGNTTATVIINDTTVPTGTGLKARYYDTASTIYDHAANFGQAGTYTYTRTSTGSPNTGTIVVPFTYNGSPALQPGHAVRMTFTSGNLNNALYNNQDYTVTAVNPGVNFTAGISAAALPTNSSGSLNFSIRSFPHPAVVERVDATVDNDWAYGTPGGNVITGSDFPDNYSSAYDGYLHPTTAGGYTFQLDADDKARVLLDLNTNGSFDLPGEQIVEHGWDGPATVGTFKQSALINLAVPATPAARYRIRVEHVETTGEARCRFQWRVPGTTTFANIPQASVFTHAVAMNANYSYTRTSSTPGAMTGTILTTLNNHGLSVGSTVDLAFSSGNLFTPSNGDFHGSYTVSVVNSTNTFTVPISAASLPASGTGAGFVTNWPTSTSTGWLNRIYGNTTFASAPGRVGVDGGGATNVNNGILGVGTPDSSLINHNTFSVRWTGQVQPQFSEDYTFVVHADDGCSLWINGELQELKTSPSTNLGGSTYHYASATGDTIVNYANSVLKLGSVVAGEKLRFDPGSGNLALGNNSTYTYDSVTGDMVVDYSNLTNVNPGGFVVGEIIEVDPTSGSVNLGLLPYTITAATATTFTVNIGANAFESGSGSINVSDNSDRAVTAVYAAGNGTYSHDQITGNTVVNFSTLGWPANTFQVGQNVLLDPTSGNLTNLAYGYKSISAVTATTFTVNYGTGFASGTGSIAIVATDSTATIPANLTGAFKTNFGAGKHANGSVGGMNINIVNKGLKDWSSMGNERYVRIPMIGGARYDIQLDYYENTSYSRCRLYWYSPSQPKQIIPAERLYPSDGPLAPATHTGATEATALAGGEFSLSIPGSNGGTVTISGNPAWLTYSDGVISGTPPSGAAGDYQIVVTTTNANGTSTSVVNLHVDETDGSIVREFWNGVAGTTVASIPTGTNPTGTNNLTSLEAQTDFGDNYGARIRGYITAPQTGNYYFWIAASNAAELWISNDDEPVNAFKRASVTTGNTTPQTWNGETSQKSPWLALEQGKRYYIEVLHKAGMGGGDNLAVGWAKPGEPETAPSEVVPGYVLSPYVAPPPGSTPGTLYIATLLSQSGAVTNAVGTATLRVSEDESTAEVRVTYNGLTGIQDGPVAGQSVAADGSSGANGVIDPTDWHVHSDPYLTHQSYIIYDGTEPPPGDGPQFDGGGNFLYHKWTIAPQGTLSAADIRELLKQGKAYINLHTAMYPNGEIRGNFTLAAGSRTFTPPPAPPSWTDDSGTVAGASRFLTQATFGASIADIQALNNIVPSGGKTRYELWIEDQFTKPASHQLDEVLRTEGASAQGGAFTEALTINAWWWKSITGDDQLRQRIAFALSEIAVVSAQGPLDDNAPALSYYYDLLNDNAFGNFRDILEKITLTPTMGRYLDMLNNDKPDQTLGRIPNENYAREIKQLFSVGLFRMWPDGSLILTSKDSPIDVYSQREIIGFSHVFTGWTYGYDGAYRTTISAPANWIRQMREVPARHFTGQKRILNNEVLPGLATLGGQSLDPYATHNSNLYNETAYKSLPAQELDATHDQLFNHPNVGPFICRQLIQRLVTSHPTRDYLYRVVQKFNDNGSGVRGDMQAVIKAILLDYDARSSTESTKSTFGKQREPLLRVTAPARAFRTTPWTGTYSQSGTRTITVTTAAPHKLANGNNVFLDFTSGSPAPWIGTYSISGTTTNSFTVQAQGWNNGTYSIPANSTTCTVTMSNHWLQVGNQVFVDFTSGTADGTSVDNQVYTVLTNPNPSSNGNNGSSFTFDVVGTSASVRSGNLMIPRFSPGSYTVSNSGLPAPQEKRITLDTNFNHELNVGDQVQLNIYGGNPEPNDFVGTVESVVDLNTYTVLSTATGNPNLATNQGFNSVFQFPLKALPLTRSGNVGNRPSSFQVNHTETDLSQTPLYSPTVFNYFLPDYKFPGSLASQGLTTPEFQLTAETNVVRQANYLYNGIFNPGNTNGISAFNSGNNALMMDYGAWMGATASNLGLGAPTSTSVPWTHNQNLTALINQFNTLLMAGQLSAQAATVIKNFIATPIASIATGTGCEVTTTVNHNLNTGDTVLVSGVTNGTFSSTLNSTTTTRTITVTSPTKFRLNGTNSVNCTAAPTAAGLTNAHVSVVQYNQGTTTPSDTNKRDRIRAILHLILTSPDYTIQR